MNDGAGFKSETLEATLAAEASRRFPVTRFKDIKWEVGPEYLIDNFLPLRGLAVIWGPPKEGKSFSVFDLLMHVVFGWKWRGRRTVRGPVVYCALEGAHGFKKRVEAFRQARLNESDAGLGKRDFGLAAADKPTQELPQIRHVADQTDGTGPQRAKKAGQLLRLLIGCQFLAHLDRGSELRPMLQDAFRRLLCPQQGTAEQYPQAQTAGMKARAKPSRLCLALFRKRSIVVVSDAVFAQRLGIGMPDQIQVHCAPS